MFGLYRCVTHVVNLVEYADARRDIRTDFLKHLLSDFELALKTGIAGINNVEKQRCIKSLVKG